MNGSIRPGISPETLAAAGVVLSTGNPDRPAPGSIAIPYHDLTGQPTSFCRWRLPKTLPSGQKYDQADVSGTRAYIPPQFRSFPTGGDLVFIEGEFKALALVDAGIRAIGLPSFNVYVNDAEGRTRMLDGMTDAIRYAKPDRLLFVGDTDTATNYGFARNAAWLAGNVAVPVLLPRLPFNGPGKGVDDIRATLVDGFDAFWQDVIATAEDIDPKAGPGPVAVRLLTREADAISALTGAAKDKERRRVVKMVAECSSPMTSEELARVAGAIFGVSHQSIQKEAGLQEMPTNDRKRPRAGQRAPEKGKWFFLPNENVTITESAQGIFAEIAKSHSLFSRGGRVVEIITGQDDATLLELVTPSAFRSRLETFGHVVGEETLISGNLNLKQRICPEATAKALLDTRESRELLPGIALLVNCPCITERNGGIKVLGRGYHHDNGGVYVLRGAIPPTVEAMTAVADLGALLADFDFATPSDRSRALASLITPAMRIGGFFGGANIPADMGEADQSQSGKTYRQMVVAALYREKPYVVSQRNGGVGSSDESLSQAVIAGRPFILFDNIRGRMDSQHLEAFLTCGGMFPARIPHKGEVQIDTTRFFVQVTSNGIEATRDLANRASLIRIRKKEAGFHFREWPDGPGLLEHVSTHQAHYLGCIFAVIREWHSRGKHRTKEHRHDFREWAQTLDWIVQNLFDAAPLMDGHEGAQQRASNPALTWLRKMALIVKTAGQNGEELTASGIVEMCRGHDIEIPGLRDLEEDQKANRRVGVLCKKIFKESSKVEIDGFTVTRIEREEYNPTQRKDVTVRAYLFAYEPELRTTAYNPGNFSKQPLSISEYSSGCTHGTQSAENESEELEDVLLV